MIEGTAICQMPGRRSMSASSRVDASSVATFVRYLPLTANIPPIRGTHPDYRR